VQGRSVVDIHEALRKLKHSKEKGLIPDDAFLAHAFVMRDEQGKEEWQLGYYSPSSALMTSFIIGETITALPAAEVLKADVGINELDPDDVKITPADALAAAEKVCKEHYKGMVAARVFYIIQHLQEVVYNITFITRQFSTINVRVDAGSGAVLHHSSENLVFMEKGEGRKSDGSSGAARPAHEATGKTPAEALRKAQEAARAKKKSAHKTTKAGESSASGQKTDH
jgi:hypothetical protein